ncbi:MAG: helix-turn-helix transcriptional regulator [Bacteroidota bacterium]
MKEFREHLGWSQEKLAQVSDCDREYISRVERKITDPQSSTLEPIILKGFQVSEKDFYDFGIIPESLKKKKEYELKKKSKYRKY